MLYIIIFCVIFLFVTDILTNHQTKFAFFELMLLLIIIMAAVTEIPDISAYKLMYEQEYDYGEYLYTLCSSLFYNYGFSYELFRFIYSIFGLSLIYYSINIIVPNSMKLWVLLLYILFPFIDDLPQVRNFMAMSIFTYAVVILSSEKKWSDFKFIILLLIASGFQIVSILYIPLILIKYVVKDKAQNKIFFVIVFSFLLLGLFSPVVNIILGVLNEYDFSIAVKIIAYSDHRSRLGFILFWTIQIINIIFTKMSFDIVMYCKEDEMLSSDLNEIKINFVKYVYFINILLLVYFPLLKIQIIFFRIVRNLFIMNAMSYSVAMSNLFYVNKIKNKKILLFVSVNVFYILLFLWQITMYQDWIYQIIETNYILNFFSF